MNALDPFIDRYALLARQRPALLVLFPVAVAVVVIFPALQTWWATMSTLVGACGVAFALGNFAQGCGKRLEPGLISLWDGVPSVAMLRWSDMRIDAVTKERYKAFLEVRVPGLTFASAEEEQRDPARADEAYQSATRWLLPHTRDKRTFSLLFQQNIGYGFRRNLLGLRSYGVTLASAALLATACAALVQPRIELLISFLVSSATLYLFVIIVRASWVKIAADAYAIELLSACDRLDALQPRPKKATAE